MEDFLIWAGNALIAFVVVVGLTVGPLYIIYLIFSS